MSTSLLKFINRRFPLPIHPFNLSNSGEMTYGEWQYQRGEDTIRFFLDFTDTAEMFADKIVLDVGCGAGGKTLYYAAQGVKRIYGMDVVERYADESAALAQKLALADKFEFCLRDAADTGFAEESVDCIIMNDAMEHVDDPEGVLAECRRILKPGGRLYVNFPPYNHPFGAHLSDVIGIPWVHCFFTERTLIASYKELVADKPDAADRVSFRISKHPDGREYFSYINKMTLHRFKRISAASGLKAVYYKEVPLRAQFAWAAKVPLWREWLVKMAVCVLEK